MAVPTLWDIQQEIAAAMKEIDSLQVDVVKLNALIQEDSVKNADLIELRDSGQREIDGKQAELADLLKKKAELEAQQKPAKFSMENHPAFTGVKASTAQTPAPEITPTTFKVNDMVMAKWINGDRQFYKAKITMVTGSASAPKFRVKFPDYNDTDEGLSLADIKPLDVSKKRKAEELLVSTPAQVNTSTNNVTTPTANTDLSLAVPARPEPSMVSDGPPKPAKVPRKIANKKVVDSHKANWKNFQAKGAKKHAPKKESMFRTPDLPNARVGFTGSGRPMAKDPTRMRNTYKVAEDDE